MLKKKNPDADREVVFAEIVSFTSRCYSLDEDVDVHSSVDLRKKMDAKKIIY